MGHYPSGCQAQAGGDRHAAIGGERFVDDSVHHLLEAIMDELQWELLAEVYGRMEAEMLQSYFEAEGIPVELFQEAVGHLIYPTTLDGLARVQLFVPKEKAAFARTLLNEYHQKKINRPDSGKE